MSPKPTGTETGGDIPYAGQWFDKGAAVYNVMHPDFGAEGDGLNDDGTAWNLVVAELPSQGGIILVPAGSYLLTTAFSFGGKDNIVLWLMPGVVLTGSALPTATGNNYILDWRSGVIDEFPVDSLADGDARQILETAADGTTVQWADNIDVPGTLDVTGATILDSTLAVAGNVTITGELLVNADDGSAIGASGTAWSDLFLASGAVIDFNSGDVTLTHAVGKITVGGDGTVEIDFSNHEMTNVDINSGAVDGTAVGAASASSGAFTSLDASGDLAVVGDSGLGASVSSTTFAALGAGTTAKSSARVIPGVAPTSPVNGDVWSTSNGIFTQANGVTWGPLGHQVYNVKAYGAVGDGSNDDTAEIQAAFDAAGVGDVVFFPDGSYKITTKLTCDRITIQGSGQYVCEIICVAVDGIEVVTGDGGTPGKNDNFHIFDIDIATQTRHTSSANTLIGITVSGDTTYRPFNHIYRNVYIDGFKTAFRSDFLWHSVFDNFRSGFGAIGIHARQLSANVVVTNGIFLGDEAVGSRGIWLEGVPTASEGWIITNNVFDDFEVGILGQGVTHVKVTNNIIDHNVVSGIAINDDGTNDFGGNWTIAGNYIAMDGAGGNAAIECNNTIVNATNRGNQIYGNHILVYATKVCAKGIWMAGSAAVDNSIIGNTLQGFAANDILCVAIAGSTNVVMGNTCLSAITDNIGSPDIALGNRGMVSGFPILTLVNDATPTIKVNDVLAPLCLSGGTTTITDFDDGRNGDIFTLLAAHALTITDGSAILLDGSRDYVMAAGDTLTLAMINDQVWEEVSRKENVDAGGHFSTLAASSTLSVTGASSLLGTVTMDGDLLHNTISTTGAANLASFDNSNNANTGAHTRVRISSGGSSGGDPFLNLGITGVLDWYIGIDNSASDAFVIGSGSSSGPSAGTNHVTVTSAGAVAMASTLAVTGTTALNNAVTMTKAANQVLTLVNATAAVLNTRSELNFQMWHSGSSVASAGVIGTIAEGTWSSTSTSRDSAIRFMPVLNGSEVERARINSTGALLVGKISGIAGAGDLDVAGNANVDGTLAVTGNTSLGGTHTASEILHVKEGAGTTPTPDGPTVAIFQRNPASGYDCGVAIISGTAATAALTFGSSDDDNRGGILYASSTDTMSFRTAAGTQATLTAALFSTGAVTLSGRVVTSTVTTLANDATPSVSAGNLFITGGTTTITDLDDGVVGQTIRILSAHTIRITDGTNMLLNGSVNFDMVAGDVLVLTMYNDQVWEEDSRKVN
jgi:hypothetical protein